MNTEENNKLIAEFMGVEKENGLYLFTTPMDDYKTDTLYFNTSWDWLMPVVKKCREIMNDFGIESMEYDFLENDIFQTDYTLIDFLNADIDCINERVVRFIKWYNENKED